MAAKCVEGEAQRERADLRQQFAACFPLDALLPTLHVGNVLTDFEFAQLLPTPRSTLVDRNHRFLEYLDKNPSAASRTLSILTRPEHLDYRSFEKMLRELFDVVEEENGTGGIPRAKRLKLQREGARVSGAREVSTLWSPTTRLVHRSMISLVLNKLLVL